MAEVKWIKITTDIFDDEKMLLIESLPDAYAMIVVWFKLICLAGKQNNGGVFMLNDRIAYTDKMLATIFRMNEATVTMALKTFEEFGMIEMVNDVITIPNWNKHQSLNAYEKKKERDRIYQQKRRMEQKALIQKSSDKSSDIVVSDIDIDKDIDIYEYKHPLIIEKNDDDVAEKKNKSANYKKIVDKYNSICKSLSKVKKITNARKKAINARLKMYSYDEIIEVFEKAEASNFLKGASESNFKANFDWLMADKNMAKVLEGRYDNKESKKVSKPKTTNKFNDFNQRNYTKEQLDELEKKLLSK